MSSFNEGLKVVSHTFDGWGDAIFLTIIVFGIAWIIVKYKLDK